MHNPIRAAVFVVVVTFFAAFAGVAVFGQGVKPVLVVLNKGDDNLMIVDPAAMKVLATVPVGHSPHEVVLSADGRTAYVANYGDQKPGSSLSVIDIASRKETRRVELAPLLRPHGLVEIGGRLYFTAETNRLVGRYDPAADRVDWLMGTGQNGSHMIVVAADQKRFFTANIGSDTVTMFDFQAVPPAASKIVQIPVGRQPEAIDLSPDGKEVWAGLNLDAGIDVIDVAAAKATSRIKLGDRPYRVRFTPDGARVVASLVSGKELAVIDAATKKEIRRIKLQSTPLGIVFSKDSKTAWVTAVEPDVILRIDLVAGTVVASLAAGRVPDGIALAGE